jgi:cellulose synthase/poly-beta-1,6-N-acetylglucosamine synthase-like glycosyltransferase
LQLTPGLREGEKNIGKRNEELMVNQELPHVSVGLPVFNGERYLRQAIESIQSQTDLELIISDNASTDATEGICREYATRDPRVRYYRSDQNRGAAWNHNRVVELARGEYFKGSATMTTAIQLFWKNVWPSFTAIRT